MASGASTAASAMLESSGKQSSREVEPRPGLAGRANDVARYLPYVFVLTILLALALLSTVGWRQVFTFVFDAVESSDHKVMQALIINGLLVTVSVCCLPAPLFFMILDGFFFGFRLGWLLCFCALFLAALISRLVAQTCLKERVRSWVNSVALLSEVFQICEEDPSGKFLVLIRFLFMPGFVKNYGMAMLDISTLKFLLVCTPGELFYSGIFSYAGSKAYQVVKKLRHGDTESVAQSFPVSETVIALMSVVIVVLLGVMGWQEYKQRREKLKLDGEREGERQPLVSGESSGEGA